MSEKRALCGICPAGCPVIVMYDRDGRLAGVRPDGGFYGGVICKLGEHSPEIVYSKDRILHPMRRKGPKGSYNFERTSWDSAYEIIVDNLTRTKERFGPEAASIYTGRGSFELSMCDVFQPEGAAVSSASSVLFPFGSPNTMGVGALCYVSFAMIAPHVTMGSMLIHMFSDIENAEMIVVWGANPATDCPPLDMKRISDARNRGAKVVVIDPRRTMTAKLTDAEWIPVRPGTDGALALGMCNVLINEELFDENFIREWTHGFDEFSRYVQHFRPDVVERITGVPSEKVLSVARKIAAADGAAPVMYSGLEYSSSGIQAIRAVHVLWALAGQLDVPGGRCFTMKQNIFPVNRKGHIPNPDVTKAPGLVRFPVYSAYRGESHATALPEAVLHGNPYQIKSLIILGGSIITAWPQPSLWRKTLHALDFLVCIDRQLTADAAYADIVLPATTMYEIESYMTYGPVFRIREKVIEPLGEARNDFFIMAELADRLGYGHLYPQNGDELLRHVLEGSGFSPEDVRNAGGTVSVAPAMMQYRKWEKGLLRTDGRPGFDTPTGKFEISSTILEDHGYDPLPVYTEPVEGPVSTPELSCEFPLVFNSGSRVTTDFRSQHHGIRGLNREHPEPTVMINTADALSRGIEHGDTVTVRTPRGKVPMRAFVTDDIMKGAVDASMGGGGPVGPEAWRRCNINELTDPEQYDPVSGFPVFKSLLCDVARTGKRSTSAPISDEYLHYASETPVKFSAADRIYLDHNATTPLDTDVLKTMSDFMEHSFGNPSGIYREGRTARSAIESARRQAARLLNCTARRIVFTSGGSEANNLVLKGVAFSSGIFRRHIITSAIEHPSVLSTCRWLESRGYNVTYLGVDSSGTVRTDQLASSITGETCLVSIMTANNETGTLQPVRELSRICREKGVVFHTDATQAVGKMPVDVEALGIDFLTFSGHKLYGPKGTGAVYMRKGVSTESLIHGGEQEYGLRAGTENTAGITGLGKACELAVKRLPEMSGLSKLRDRLEQDILQIVPSAGLNGHSLSRLPNTLNICLPGYRGESLVIAMDRKGIAFSSGSACMSSSPEPSHALLAMGLTEEDAHCSVRFSLGAGNTPEEIERTVSCLRDVMLSSAHAVRFVPCR